MAESRRSIRGALRLEQPYANDRAIANIRSVRGYVHQRSSTSVQTFVGVRLPPGRVHGELLRDLSTIEIVQQPPHRPDQSSGDDDRRVKFRGSVLSSRRGRENDRLGEHVLDLVASFRPVVVRPIPFIRHDRVDELACRNRGSRYKGTTKNGRTCKTRSPDEAYLRRRDGTFFGSDAKKIDEIFTMDRSAATITFESCFNRSSPESEREQTASRFVSNGAQGRQGKKKLYIWNFVQ